jgi:N-acetyl-anhydromuramyl-L-alanine amidase AmpD
MGRIIIAGKPRNLPPDIQVTTFLDPGGKSFYQQTSPALTPRVATDADGVTWELVKPRRCPVFRDAQLGGGGWEAADPDRTDPVRGLRQVVHAVVLHHDAAQSSDACFRTLLDRHYSTHFMIDRDGHVWQAADVADETIHATVMNQVAVGIDLNNPADNLLDSPGATAAGRAPSATAEINGSQYRSWTYTEEQYRSLVALLRVLVEDLQVQPVFPVDETGAIVGTVLDTDPKEFHGILCHWHVQAEKWDPGPGLDWERILRDLREEGAAIPVIPEGLHEVVEPADRAAWGRDAWTDRDTADKAVVAALKDERTADRLCRAVCRASERGADGGWYPMGINQTWHGGIHVPARRGAIVRPLLRGELVAAHLVPATDFPEAGSNNFVLLRHRIPLPPRASAAPEEPKPAAEGTVAPTAPTNVLTVFSLYMHLDGVDLAHPPEGRLFERLAAHEAARDPEPEPAPGPTLAAMPDFNQVKSMRRGYVGIFSEKDRPASSIELDPRDAIGFAGELNEARGDRRVVHVEVFADASCMDAMELGLYGRYIQPGPDEPESADLVVRSWTMLSLFKDAARRFDPVIHTPKTLDPAALRDFFDAERDEQETLRRMIVRHVSEWSDAVDWVSALVSSQEGRRWMRHLADGEARWVFRNEAAQFLPFTWLTKDVADRIGLAWDNGLVYTFHPIRFLQWWMYRRSAVRGKTLEALLAEVGGRKDLSTTKGVPEVLSDLTDL